MKKVFLALVLAFISTVSFSQNGNGYQGSTYTYQSGTYSAELNATITIAPNAQVIFTTLQIDGGSLTLGAGSTVTIKQISNQINSTVIISSGATLKSEVSLNINGHVTIQQSASLSITGDLNLDLANNSNSGTITVSGTTILKQASSLTFNSCSVLSTNNLTNLAGNPGPVNGSGYIVISGNYGGSGNQFTTSPNLRIKYSGTNLSGPDNDGTTLITPNGDVSSTATNACSTVTPVLFTNVSAQLIDGTLNFKWTTTMESNNKLFSIEGSSDGVTWTTVGEVNTYWDGGNSSVSHDYLFTFYDLEITEAGIGSAFGMLIVLGFIVGLLKSEKKKVIVTYAGLIILAVMTFSCHKTNGMVKSNNVKYKYFRIKSVDLDTTEHYYQPIFKVA